MNTVVTAALSETPLGRNWMSTFIKRHQDVISSQFYRVQEVARLKADTPGNRQAFYDLVKSVLDTGLYTPGNIYNMDEAFFELSSSRRTRRVAPRNTSIKAQSSLASNTHITLVAAISTSDAPIPPFIIYPGLYLMEEWLSTMDEEPKMMAAVSNSGWINGYLALQWLRECFDPATQERAGNGRRLLFLDGHDTHTQVSFLEACWDRNIVCVILPAHMSNIFQPLDVNFFNSLKFAYHKQIDDYQLGSNALSVPKSFFYRWLQRAWASTATSRQIQVAWANCGLFPLNRAIMGAVETTPEPASQQTDPEIPHSARTIQTIDRQVQRGEISPLTAFHKTSKAFIRAESRRLLAEQDLAKQQAAQELDRSARTSNKRTRFPQGHLYDQKYQEEHAEELAEHRAAERQRKGKEKAAAWPGKQPEASNTVQTDTAGPSTSTQEEIIVACI